MTHPTCAYDCIALVYTEDPCDLQLRCLCTSKNYLTGVRNCLSQYCDATDTSAWLVYGEAQCAAVGITFSSTVAATATAAPGPQSTSVTYQTSIVTSVSSPDATTIGSSASTAGAQPASTPTTQNSKSGLGVGAIAGIAVGAALILLIAVLIAVLLWRRNGKQPPTLPPGSGSVREIGTNTPGSNLGSDLKPMPTSNVAYKPELHTEPAIYATNYEKQPFIPKGPEDQRYPSQQLAPMPQDSVRQVSLSSAESELVRAVPSEVEASTLASSEYRPPYHHSYVEADSARQNHITSPISELGNAAYQRQYELPTKPHLTQYSTEASNTALTPRELSSTPAHPPSIPVLEPHTPVVAGGGVAEHVDGDAEDAELNRMKFEIEALRVEKDRVLHLQALEERERELSRKIVNRELFRGAGN